MPEATTQGRILAPQAISAVDISADGKFITVGTMAFSHDTNVWQLDAQGTVIAQRHLPPWAPLQVATLNGGRALAAGLAYSRVTSPDPTVWSGRIEELFAPKLNERLATPDAREGELARFRPGEGNWRTGWFASSFGELFVSGPDWVYQPPKGFLDADGRRTELRFEDKNLLPTSRALRMSASADGQRIAFGWIGFSRDGNTLTRQAAALDLWGLNPDRKLWSAPTDPSLPTPPRLPEPAADFIELGKEFRVTSDAILSGHASAAIAMDRDGSRVAVIEYGIWGWVRNGPAIGKWDPPIHVLNFLPRQKGRLRVFNGQGQEVFNEWLPEPGLFEVGFSGATNEVWCWPASWFARGMAGEPWLPVDSLARSVFRISLSTHTAEALVFPDAIAACATTSAHRDALVSCWDGLIYLLQSDGSVVARHDAGSPSRLAWSRDGAFAIVGTSSGRLMRLERNGKIGWSREMNVSPAPPLKQPPSEVVPGLPIFQAGRIPQGEHAYVGDIWAIKAGRNGIIVDAGGLSGHSQSQARLQALGVEQVTHVLLTHTHGDHCGGAYLWRAGGAKIVAPKSAALSLTWLMPMLTDYGIYPPRPLDVSLPLTSVGEETDFEVSGLKFRALFVPGHSFDLTIYTTELDGKRVAFTGDLGFENQDILHRCWGDVNKARRVVGVIKDKLLPWKPEVVFTGHGVRTNGFEFLNDLVRATERSLTAQ